ncbi:ABC transporter substrate-binding protein [Tumebacillus permanentifrigoris]|uniref:NitT/TauT family transport system substrate-binding protein n=1 Tax=Tumebacillus permanentifrigoris TaxID=378543 RepID=A0A316DDW8_9BACL|nr:ABC transporter substrate-binding protein [Tumebacillus permanentifrigoris]PWK15828.1 NitT/TauT family transport system substrate-binding protein [Tumebacillus permanentifrigoris]
MNTWKKFACGVTLGAMLFTLTACGGDSNTTDDGKLETVRLTEVIRSIFYAPHYVAIEKGYFKEQGLDIQLDTAWGGDKATTRLLANQDDIALVGAETTIFVQQQGAPDALVSFAQATQRDGSFLVARQSATNFDWSQLKGKSLLGSRAGSMPEMVSEYVQKQHGLKPFTDNQIIQNIAFDNQAAAFASGTGDFFQAFEPAASLLEKQGQGHVVASFGQDIGTLPYTVFMAKSSYLKSHPETVQKFTNAVQKAQDYLHTAKPEEVASVIKPYFTDVDQEILVRVVKRYQESDAWPTNTVIDQQEFANMKKIMQTAGELKKDVAYETVVEPSFSEKAKQK